MDITPRGVCCCLFAACTSTPARSNSHSHSHRPNQEGQPQQKESLKDERQSKQTAQNLMRLALKSAFQRRCPERWIPRHLQDKAQARAPDANHGAWLLLFPIEATTGAVVICRRTGRACPPMNAKRPDWEIWRADGWLTFEPKL